jgi:BirA family transcriptional regulator, biotin operon repressor / biotin---[acetyl-CoA-carboxylase] ligase
MNDEILRSQLAGQYITEVRYFNAIGSTNDEALNWSAAGARDFSLVIADTQTRGRGRLGRKWVTKPGAALAFSLIFKFSGDGRERLNMFSPLGAVAVCQALEDGWALQPKIKWPNDVLLQGRKVCGILVEAAWSGAKLDGVVVGIGINVTAEAVPPDDQVVYPAISVEQAAGEPVDRLALLKMILSKLRDLRPRLETGEFFTAWESRLAFLNQRVMLKSDVEKPGESSSYEGILVGVDRSGALLLKLDSGEVKPMMVGDLHLRPARSD